MRSSPSTSFRRMRLKDGGIGRRMERFGTSQAHRPETRQRRLLRCATWVIPGALGTGRTAHGRPSPSRAESSGGGCLPRRSQRHRDRLSRRACRHSGHVLGTRHTGRSIWPGADIASDTCRRRSIDRSCAASFRTTDLGREPGDRVRQSGCHPVDGTLTQRSSLSSPQLRAPGQEQR